MPNRQYVLGAMFPVSHIALQHINPLYFSFLRYLSVTLILVVLLWLKEGRTAFRFEGKGKTLLFFGTMGFTIYNMAVFQGQHAMGAVGTRSLYNGSSNADDFHCDGVDHDP